MDFFGKYQSPFGYQNGDNGIDSYGVDHSGFSTQDELQYQILRPILMGVMDFPFMAAGVKVQPDV